MEYFLVIRGSFLFFFLSFSIGVSDDSLVPINGLIIRNDFSIICWCCTFAGVACPQKNRSGNPESEGTP